MLFTHCSKKQKGLVWDVRVVGEALEWDNPEAKDVNARRVFEVRY